MVDAEVIRLDGHAGYWLYVVDAEIEDVDGDETE